VHRASTEVKVMFLRKRSWKILENEFSFFTQCIKIKIYYNYQTHISNPLSLKKKEVAEIFENRQ
jgi:hypothetical protein